MKFERIGFIYLLLIGLVIVIFLPIAITAIAPVMIMASNSISQMLDFFLNDTAATQTQQFAKALVFSFTGAFIVFMGIGITVQNIVANKKK